ESFGLAFAKSQLAAGQNLPLSGTVFISVRDKDKMAVVPIAQKLANIGFKTLATRGTAAFLASNGIACETVHKVSEGRPHVVDHIKNGAIQLVINTSLGASTTRDSYKIRRATLDYRISYTTTIAGAKAIAAAIEAMLQKKLQVRPIQEYHGLQSDAGLKTGTGINPG
ncbi:MAG: carbamoyl phosphate synthase large subunit, partial [Deltaproteobacteria bacterium]|nr:carbamoyl phosphate synthase large subunit [Deltaproteobacteria bacterium]